MRASLSAPVASPRRGFRGRSPLHDRHNCRKTGRGSGNVLLGRRLFLLLWRPVDDANGETRRPATLCGWAVNYP
jgi:hypothetical protein